VDPTVNGRRPRTSRRMAGYRRRRFWDLITTTLQQDLSERQRLAFVAQFIEDRTSGEIAEELNVSRNAVYMLIFEARKKIKRRLLEAGHAPEDVLEVFQEQ